VAKNTPLGDRRRVLTRLAVDPRCQHLDMVDMRRTIWVRLRPHQGVRRDAGSRRCRIDVHRHHRYADDAAPADQRGVDAQGVVLRRHPMLTVRAANIWRNIIGYKWMYLAISGVVIIPGIVVWAFFGGLNKGIDFDGGHQLEMQLTKQFTGAQIEQAAKAAGINNAKVQTSKGNRRDGPV